MRISLVFPTRERGGLLGPCLAGALACDDPDLEVVVSDNHSTDGTAEMLARIDDPRLKVVRPEGRVSMRRNFETGLNAATGDYVILSGDDDGVSPAGMAILRRVLERHQPDAVGWDIVSYGWPSTRPGQECGLLPIKYSSVYGRLIRRDPAAILEQLCSARLRKYREAANIYHGCISRRLIDRIRETTGGTYFSGAIPDVYSSIANLMHMQGDLLWLSHPITFGGDV